MTTAFRIAFGLGTLVLCMLLAAPAFGNAFVRGAYYRLGDDDPGAAAGAIGDDPTIDSFSNHLDLSRFGAPRYSADLPARGPYGDTLSMNFANPGSAAPSAPQFYGTTTSLDMVEQGYALEAWVKPTSVTATSSGDELIAYNGDPASNGFGLFVHAGNYVARIGTFERTVGPADANVWHHVAYVQELGTNYYYLDGKSVGQSTKDPLPTAATGGFWLAGQGLAAANPQYLFDGTIDEVRYQSYNPLAAGAFDPTAFLISDLPEPTGACVIVVGALMLLRRRFRF